MANGKNLSRRFRVNIMGIKKGDLVAINLKEVERMSFVEVQEELFSSLGKLTEEDYLISLTNPYEHNHPMIGQSNSRNGIFVYNALTICVDLILGEDIFKAVPVKYLKRVVQ